MTRGADIAVDHLAAWELEKVRECWIDLHRHHAALAPAGATARDEDESWRRQRRRYEAFLRDPQAFLLVGRTKDGVAGYVMTHMTEGLSIWKTSDMVSTVETLAVRESHRGQGIGSALLEAAWCEARSRGAEEQWLAVLATNEAALRFYENRKLVRFSIEYRRTTDA